MKRLFASASCFAVAIAITACGSNKQAPTNESANQSAQTAAKDSPATPQATQPAATTQAGELQPGQASGTYTAKGQVVELKYSYAGRAERFGTESMVILLTENPIPAEAVAEEIKSAALLEGEKLRGLEYVIDENSMWVRYHPGQYQESSSNKLKEYKVENGVVRGIDDNDGDLSDGKYARKVKFAAAIAK
ncbi:MAG TPA: hypothetical protein VFT02_08820 [Pyrinomonadaceae bacterium]|nr:hypothetical protein [Pyrinomonadaceae bacterium]